MGSLLALWLNPKRWKGELANRGGENGPGASGPGPLSEGGAPCLCPHQLGLIWSLGLCPVGLSGAGVSRVELVFLPERLSCPAPGRRAPVAPDVGADGHLLSPQWQVEPRRTSTPLASSESCWVHCWRKHSPRLFEPCRAFLLPQGMNSWN